MVFIFFLNFVFLVSAHFLERPTVWFGRAVSVVYVSKVLSQTQRDVTVLPFHPKGGDGRE